MKLKIEQEKLAKAISILSKAVATRTSMEILKGIYFLATDDELVLASNNLEIGIQTSIKCEIIEKGQLVIESKVISDIIRKLPNDTITLETAKDINYIQMRCQNINFSIKYIPCNEFPMPEYIDEKMHFPIDAKEFKDLITKTGYAISINESKSDLMVHFIKIYDNNMLMFSIDGYRMALMEKRITEDLKFDPKYIMIQGKIMIDIANIIENDTENIKFAYTDKHISVIVGETVITTNLVVQEFKDYKSLIPQSFNSSVRINLEDFRTAIERVSTIANNRLVVLETSNTMMKVNSKNEQVGEAIEVIDINLEGENFVIGFNCNYLLDAIKHIDSENIILNVIDSLSACIITPEDNKGYINLLLPVRMR